MIDGYGFDGESVRRVGEAVRYVERLAHQPAGPPVASDVVFVRVTGNETATGSGRWPCVTGVPLADGTWDETGSTDPASPSGYLRTPGVAVAPGVRVAATPTGDHTDGLPQWVMLAGGQAVAGQLYTQTVGVTAGTDTAIRVRFPSPDSDYLVWVRVQANGSTTQPLSVYATYPYSGGTVECGYAYLPAVSPAAIRYDTLAGYCLGNQLDLTFGGTPASPPTPATAGQSGQLLVTALSVPRASQLAAVNAWRTQTLRQLTGHVYRDVDQDGAYTAGTDTLLTNRRVVLAGGGQTFFADVEFAAGNYAIYLPPGTWTLGVVQAADDEQCPLSPPVTIPSTGTVPTCDVRVVRPASVSGVVFVDANGNGVRDGESAATGSRSLTCAPVPPAGGWTTGTPDPGTQTVTVDPDDGTWSVRLAPATWRLSVVTLPGESAPAPGYVEITVGTADRPTPVNVPVRLTTYAVSGRAYTDANADGAYSAGTDSPAAGLVVLATGSDGVTRSAVCDAAGLYLFAALPASVSYTVATGAGSAGRTTPDYRAYTPLSADQTGQDFRFAPGS